jgi:hexosaminidase
MKSYLFRQKFDLVLTLMSISCVIIHSQAIAAGMEGMKLSLMPWPQTIELTRSEFRLDTSFRITMVGSAPDRLYAGATRALYRLQQRTGLTFGQGGFVTRDQSADSASMVIRCATAGKVELGVDESYALSVSNTRVELSAQTDIGALRGLETFLQLLSVDETGSYVPGVEIVDKPRFPWRGLLIDAGRHFMPVEVLTRNLDAMAAVKLNVLHLHLTEDQGFRIESKIYPRLHEMGSDGLYYTQVQIREIIDYAADRGIRVIPEFDVPGHTTSWLVGHPELGSAPGPYQIERHWGIKYPALNPVNEFTYEFLDNFFAEMGSLFPDPYFHIGGDEIEHGNYHEARHWNENPEIQAFKKKNNIADNFALQAYFNSRVLKILTGHGKVMVGWDEILHETMPTNIVIQSWRGRDSMVRAAEAGFQSILSNG